MNRKEGIIVSALLLTIFFGSVFAAPAVQNMFIVNDPLNVRIVDGTSTPQTTSVDIEVFASTIANGIYLLANNLVSYKFPIGFSFVPAKGFVQVQSVLITIVYNFGESSPGDMLSVSLNGESSGTSEIQRNGAITAIVGTIQNQRLRPGSNLMEIGIIPTDTTHQIQLYVQQVRLTVEYTFMA